MLDRINRNLSIRDILVLTAAIAVGLAWMRHFQNCEAGSESYPYLLESSSVTTFRYRAEVLNWWLESLGYCVGVVAVAVLGLLVLRTSRPRRRLRYLTRHPGVVAGGAVLLTLSFDLGRAAYEIIEGVTSGREYDSAWQFSYLYMSSDHAAVAVGSAWTLLALSGRWRRERGWLDALGVGIGVFWLVHCGLDWWLNLEIWHAPMSGGFHRF